MIYDFAIIGGGPTGYSAAMYAGRLGLQTIIFTGAPGGLLINIQNVENYPGFKSISGFELFKKIQEQAKEYGIQEIASDATMIQVSLKSISANFIIKTKKAEFYARTILFATGSKWRKLPLPEAKRFEHRGVHYCALCDGFAYKNKTVAVVGGSDGALKEALELAQLSKKVYLIARGEQLKGEAVNLQKVRDNHRIEIILRANIVKIIGDDKIEAVKLDRPYQNSNQIAVNGIFVAIGHLPNSALAEQLGVKLNQKKEIMIDRYSQTNVDGIYAAGDVVDSEFKQLITGCAEAVRAVYEAFEHITRNT